MPCYSYCESTKKALTFYQHIEIPCLFNIVLQLHAVQLQHLSHEVTVYTIHWMKQPKSQTLKSMHSISYSLTDELGLILTLLQIWIKANNEHNYSSGLIINVFFYLIYLFYFDLIILFFLQHGWIPITWHKLWSNKKYVPDTCEYDISLRHFTVGKAEHPNHGDTTEDSPYWGSSMKVVQ